MAGCGFQLSACVVLFLILRLIPDNRGDPTRTTTTGESPLSIRFAPVCLKIYGCEVVSSSKFSHLRTSRSLLTVVLLLLAGDVEVNPGSTKYPCTLCSKPVRKNQRGILCDKCKKWTHASCCGITKTEYQLIGDNDDQWFCPTCLRNELPYANCSLSSLESSTAGFLPELSNTSQEDHSAISPLAGKLFKVNSVVPPKHPKPDAQTR